MHDMLRLTTKRLSSQDEPHQIGARQKKKKKKKRETLFSNHNGSLPGRQPGAMTIGHGPKEIGNILNPSNRCLFEQGYGHSSCITHAAAE